MESEITSDFVYEFPEWDILREVQRRMRRSERCSKSKDIREWMRAHPTQVALTIKKAEGK